MKLSIFVNESQVSEALVRAVVKQVGGWADFKQLAEDVVGHGANCGFPGFTYYSETMAFADKNRADILKLCREMAESLGEDSAYSLIAGFSCLGGLKADNVADAVHEEEHPDRRPVRNALAWFALEEVCRSYVDCVEAE